MEYSVYTCYAVNNPDPGFNPHRYSSGATVNIYGIEAIELLQEVQANLVRPKLEQLHEHVQFSDINIKLIKSINQYLFSELYGMAGKIRTQNAWIIPEKYFIPGLAVRHTPAKSISTELKLVIQVLKSTDWSSLSEYERYEKLAILITKLWIIHPCIVGNTETIIGFLEVFCHLKGWNINMPALIKLLDRPVDENGKEGISFRDMLVGVWLSLYDEDQAKKDPSYKADTSSRIFLINALKQNIQITAMSYTADVEA